MALHPRARAVAEQLRIRRALGQVMRRRRRLPRQLPPRAIEREYAAALLRLVARLRPALDELLRELPSIMADVARERGDSDERLDAGGDRAKGAVDRMAGEMSRAITQEEIESLAREFAAKTATAQRVQLGKQVRAALGADVLGSEAGVDAAVGGFVQANVALIKNIPQKMAQQFELTVAHAVASSTPHPQLAKQLEQQWSSLGPTRAKLIARDQVGKLTSQINQVRQKNLGVTRYLWRGVLDRRERPEHVRREGQEFSWDAPPPDGHPGTPILCRCSAEPIFDDILAGLDDVVIPESERVTPKRARKPRAPKAAPAKAPKVAPAPKPRAPKVPAAPAPATPAATPKAPKPATPAAAAAPPPATPAAPPAVTRPSSAFAPRTKEWADAVMNTGALSREERRAVDDYTGTDFRVINNHLRGQKLFGKVPKPSHKLLSGKTIKQTVAELDSAMAKSVIPEDVILYRGLRDVSFAAGDVFVDPAYLSTTLDREIAEKSFAYGEGGKVLEIEVPAGSRGVYASGVAGGAEQEVTLPRGSTLHVISVDGNRVRARLVSP